MWLSRRVLSCRGNMDQHLRGMSSFESVPGTTLSMCLWHQTQSVQLRSIDLIVHIPIRTIVQKQIQKKRN